MEPQKATILLVEDEPNLAEVMKDFLEMSGFSVSLCMDGETALQRFKENTFDICIFDVMLPRKDGFELAEDVRKINEDTPIVFLTARSQKEDRVRGFKAGCDDYITKPFSTEEFILRIEAILKRCKGKNFGIQSQQKPIFQLGPYTFDYANFQLSHGENSQQLTPKEAELLMFFCKNRNQVIQRELILKEVWGDDSYFNSRSLDVFITRLRKLLKDEPGIAFTSIHGMGYRFDVKQ